MKIKVGDKVVVIAGKDKGKTGKITKVSVKHNQVVIEKLNLRTKHIKKTQNKAGEKIRYEAPINVSNVMILDPKDNKPTRIGYKFIDNGKKERVSKLSGISLDKLATENETKKKTAEKEEKEPENKESKAKTTKSSKKKTIKA